VNTTRPYDPYRGLGRRPIQAVRVFTPKQSLALYLYEMFVLVAVVGVFVWTIR
jgi:hypothetical protein